MGTKSVLVVEDEAPVRKLVLQMLGDANFEVRGVASVDDAVEELVGRSFDVVLSDVRMPDKTGLDLVAAVKETHPDTPVVLMTGYASIDSAVEAMRRGAFDYVTKPFKWRTLVMSLERAVAQRAPAYAPSTRPNPRDQSNTIDTLVAVSPALRGIQTLIRRVADTRSSVLITGESGTGKEHVARALHFSGKRANAPFVPVNCSAIADGLLESELFGHRRGAFTGAFESKPGVFELAHAGTLFLDEIGDMGLGLQGKVLRVIEDQEIRAVGGTQPTTVDVRIVAATNKDLSLEMARGRFRRDLFYRLNVIPIHIPPLRERPEDIRALSHLLLARQVGESPRRLSEEAIHVLMRQPWEGNVRQLRNVIERALAISDREVLEPEDLQLDESTGDEEPAVPGDFVQRALESKMTLRDIEALVIRGALESTGGNKARAASLLGISRRTLYRRGGGPLSPTPSGRAPRRPAQSE